VIAPEEFLGERAIGRLHLDTDVTAVTVNREFQATLATASGPGSKTQPTTTGQIPRREALAYGRMEVVVIGAREAGAQVSAVLSVEQADCECGREVGLPGRLECPQLAIHGAWIETTSLKNRQACS